jgi:hypothetical protein
MDPTYIPLIARDEQLDQEDTRRSRCKNIAIYSAFTIALIVSIAAVVYLFVPRHRASSDTVTIVNRHRDDISIFQVDKHGREKFLAHLGPNDRARLHPDPRTHCFVRHLGTTVAIQQIAVDGSTVVIGDEPDAAAPSLPGGLPVTVTFVNHEPEAVLLSWIDFTGTPVDMNRLDPDESLEINTFVDHVFLLSDAFDLALIKQVTIHSDSKVVGTRQAESSDRALSLIAENHTPDHMKLFWQDTQGDDHLIGDLPPNTKTVVDTFIGHKLFFVDANGVNSKPMIVYPSTSVLRAINGKVERN